jgi:hypothetical protein
MSKIEVNTVAPQCGTTLTLGESGDTVTLGAGASQSGFGRTGTVDWQTGSIKTATFTAANGEGYFANTSGGAFTMNLPAGSAGNIVSVVDYTNTFQTNNLTISPNGSQKIGGIAANSIASTEGQSLTFVYVDDTEGWKNVQDSTSNVVGNPFIVATGGTITTCGNCKIHTFTGPGSFCVSQVHPCAANNEVSYMVVAGGGGGGGFQGGGGAGAGGFREDKSSVTPYTASPLEGAGPITVTATAFPITVGGGGAGGPCGVAPQPPGGSGGVSTFSTITSAGGGGGGRGGGPCGSTNGANGGSGGGGGGRTGQGNGLGNTPPVSPAQGRNGGSSKPEGSPSNDSGGGGGGAGDGGSDGGNDSSPGGNGGNGATTSISGSPTTYAGGGGGAREGFPNGTGGTGGGGNGTEDATANTGGGGGGGNGVGNTGGSGIVIIRYKFQ